MDTQGPLKIFHLGYNWRLPDRGRTAKLHEVDQPNKCLLNFGVIPINRKRLGSPEQPEGRAAETAPRQARCLEHELYSKLDASRSAATQDRIAQTHVRRCRERVKSLAAAQRKNTRATSGADAIEASVGKESRKQRTGKVRMVCNVVEIRPELQLEALSDRRHLADGKIEVSVIRAKQ